MNILIELNILEVGENKYPTLKNEASFKKESGSPVGGALTQVPHLAAYKTSRRQNFKREHFSPKEIYLLLLRKGRRITSCPSDTTWTTPCSL